jgi:arylsulfatase A-like enzyme
MSEARIGRPGILISAALAAVLGIGFQACCTVIARAAVSTRPRNIVVVVMDTARQDRLSCYGYERDTTPRLRELAATSTLYLNAYSTSSWTRPAHASLFTGLYPVAHGATQENWRLGLSLHLTTIAEVLSEHGYRTTGIVENPMLAPQLGYSQGFARYDQISRPNAETAVPIPALARFAEALDAAPRGQPFFVFVNLIAPHSPYNLSRQFKGTFVSDPTIALESNMWPEFYLGTRTFSEGDLRHLNELYDETLLYTDYVVGRMADDLRSRGLWDETAFIVTSDHGENIGDHGHMDHVFTLYETTTKIPLLIHCPDLFAQGSRVADPVQLTDLFPTCLALAAIDVSSYPSHGRDLASVPNSGRDEVLCEYYYPRQALECLSREDAASPRLAPYLRRIRSLSTGGMKLIWGSDGRNELYDLVLDPGETANLIDSPAYGAVARTMEQRLVELVERYEADRREPAPPTEEIPLDPATKEALRSLGYLR